MKSLIPVDAMEALRLAKASEAARRGDFDIFPKGNGVLTLYSWKVNDDGKKVKSRYDIDLEAWTCSCPDFQNRGKFCKHLLYADDIAREEEQEAFLESMADGEAFMSNLHTERSLVY